MGIITPGPVILLKYNDDDDGDDDDGNITDVANKPGTLSGFVSVIGHVV